VYCEAVSRDAEDGAELQWHRSDNRLTVAFGTSGIVMLIEEVLTTAFLPGQGDPRVTHESQRCEKLGGLPRERGMRTGRPGRRGGEEVERDRRVRERHEAQWTNGQRLYYRVFRPAVQFVKKCQHRCLDRCGKVIPGDYALIKDVLPARSRLKYTDWVALRHRCGRGV
jgi:hypothetical protein